MSTAAMTYLLDERPNISVDHFLQNYASVHPIEIPRAKQQIKLLLKYYGSSSSQRNDWYINLEAQWYQALAHTQIDYSVYDDDYYFADLWACWIRYSRKYLRAIRKPDSLTKSESLFPLLKACESIVDLGCGIGYTTAALKQLVASADVYGTNLETTKQYSFCQQMSQQYQFTVVPNISVLPRPIDAVFASEYFEHIEKSIEHLDDVVSLLRPKLLIIANAFNTRSLGHFTYYKFRDQNIPQQFMSRLFNRRLSYLGFKRVRTRLWNNRPSIWVPA